MGEWRSMQADLIVTQAAQLLTGAGGHGPK